MIRLIRAEGCEARALITRLVFRTGPGALRARLFVPEQRALPANLVDLLAGPENGGVYLAMDENRPVGLVNIAPGPGAEQIEVGLLVADRWQRRGIGRDLMRFAAQDPRWAGMPLVAAVQTDNRRVIRLLRSLHWPMRLADTAPGEYYFELHPVPEQLRVAG
ncbi:GNAT family N-acetyltransferase [Pseudonocardia spinosispora]|uniref:GNAT family N-acetyltransferase n=1 Tax=Pseudonocardia spinosispora TaxID=103441 RepID=UPI0003FCBFD6|nr:GNAT family N-acetyltransferase [Pseudonocardia spinosispora]